MLSFVPDCEPKKPHLASPSCERNPETQNPSRFGAGGKKKRHDLGFGHSAPLKGAVGGGRVKGRDHSPRNCFERALLLDPWRLNRYRV